MNTVHTFCPSDDRKSMRRSTELDTQAECAKNVIPDRDLKNEEIKYRETIAIIVMVSYLRAERAGEDHQPEIADWTKTSSRSGGTGRRRVFMRWLKIKLLYLHLYGDEFDERYAVPMS